MLGRIRIHSKMKRRPAHLPRHRVDHRVFHPNTRMIQLCLMPRRDQRRISLMPDKLPRALPNFRQRHVLNTKVDRRAKPFRVLICICN